MTVHELNRAQLIELKQYYLTETRDAVSWGDLADADEIITDAVIYEYFSGCYFSPDDFTGGEA